MKVYKFGGASVKDAAAVKNVARILEQDQKEKKVVVISAMGKTTNMLEEVHLRRLEMGNWKDAFEKVANYHHRMAEDLGLSGGALFQDFQDLLVQMDADFAKPLSGNTALEYDRVVGQGEVLSTLLISAYLEQVGLNVEWVDVRNVIKTNNEHRRAEVDWERSQKAADILLAHLEEDTERIIITQGFIAQSKLGNTTTLGREGSDFSAAIIAYLLNAGSVTIWKDVPGMLNADPKWFNNTVQLPHISYNECIELSYYGASVIHPKTLKPLQNKNIPLFVKSFNDVNLKGTVIDATSDYDTLVPMYIFKPNQVLLSIKSRDFSFIVEKNLSDIFDMISESGLRVNMMQNSAISFSIVVDQDDSLIKGLREMLQVAYEVKYNDGLDLLTIRHYDEATVKSLTTGKEILMEQRSRQTLRFVLR